MTLKNFLTNLLNNDEKGAVKASQKVDKKAPLPIERRAYPRFNVCWHFRVENNGRILEAESIDIAVNGIGLWVRRGTSALGDCRVTFQIPHGHGASSGKFVEVTARAVRAHDLEQGGMLWGIAFVSFAQGKEEYLHAMSFYS